MDKSFSLPEGRLKGTLFICVSPKLSVQETIRRSLEKGDLMFLIFDTKDTFNLSPEGVVVICGGLTRNA